MPPLAALDLAAHAAAPDLAAARENMVNGQLTPARVRDPRIIEAMGRLPRERFVFADGVPLAYADRAVPLGGGRVLMEPRIIARLVQILMPRAGERALVVASGSGYGAALLASLGLEVTAVEEDERLLALARAATADLGRAIEFHHASPLGWGEGRAPYACVLVEGAVEAIPGSFSGLVAAQGRLATVLQPAGQPGRGVLAEPVGGALRPWPHFDAATAVLPGFTIPPAFRF